jgi:hypothetical protein
LQKHRSDYGRRQTAFPLQAVRHGLTAETVIDALEDAEDYKAFEAAIIADYDAQSAGGAGAGVAVSQWF